MWAASNLAVWWDKKNKESDKALLEFVDEHPNWWVIGAVAQTGMEFAGVMVVDVLRFGEGAAESYETGKIAPLIQDVFRGMTIVSSAGKAVQLGRPLVGRAIGLYANVRGPVCVPITVGNAVRRAGQRFLLSLEEIARAHGVSGLKDIVSGLNITQTLAALRKLGVAFRELGAAGTWEGLITRFAENEGVVMIRIVGDKATSVGHYIILEKVGGVVRILDRYGEFANLEALSARYSSVLGGGKFVLDPKAIAILVKQVSAKLLNGIPSLMIEANAIVKLAEGKTVQELDAKFEDFKAQKSGKERVIHLTAAPKVTVARGDTLSGLAGKHYGSVEYWPLIWDVNKETIGTNPNRISPGMTLAIPPLSAFSEKEKADARRRHPTWKNYH